MFFHNKIETLLVVAFIIERCSCLIKVLDTENNKTVHVFNDAESHFGGEFFDGTMAYLVESNPILACNKTIIPPPIYLPNSSNIIFVALIKRGLCTFEHKIRTAQDAGYRGVIIYNNNSDHPFRIPAPSFPNDIRIPSTMVGRSSGHLLRKYTFSLVQQQFIVIFYDNVEFNPIYYIIAFLGFISLGFLVIGIGFSIRLCRDCIKRRANRLKKSDLKKIPVKKFVKGEDHFDMCAICLDDFVDGDKLRILMCNHAYHTKCIDPWLLKQQRNCPVCKSKVKILGRGEESDDSVNVARQSENVIISINEHTPLINSRDQVGSQSYFSYSDSDVNFEPVHPKSSASNFYENPCIVDNEVNSSSTEPIAVLVVGMSINNDTHIETVTPASNTTDTNNGVHHHEDLTKMV